MCLAIPNKVIKIEKDWVTVQSGDHQHRANLSLLKNIKIGDYILIHDGLALNKIPKADAKKILKIIEDHSNAPHK